MYLLSSLATTESLKDSSLNLNKDPPNPVLSIKGYTIEPYYFLRNVYSKTLRYKPTVEAQKLEAQ